MLCLMSAVDSKFFEGVKKVFGMGDDQKELVDPYFIFSFAGKEVSLSFSFHCPSTLLTQTVVKVVFVVCLVYLLSG